MRLDLYYVENWSTTGDTVILWRDVKAVLRRRGLRDAREWPSPVMRVRSMPK